MTSSEVFEGPSSRAKKVAGKKTKEKKRNTNATLNESISAWPIIRDRPPPMTSFEVFEGPSSCAKKVAAKKHKQKTKTKLFINWFNFCLAYHE